MKITASTLPKLLVLVTTISLALPIHDTSRPTTYSISKTDMKCMVDNVYHEARNQPFIGQVAVARVVFNRYNLYRNKSLCDIVYAKNQFSWTHKRAIVRDMAAYNIAGLAVLNALDFYFPAYYYHRIDIKPNWSKHMQPVAVLGDHVFY